MKNKYSQGDRVIVKKYFDQSIQDRMGVVHRHLSDKSLHVIMDGTGVSIFVKKGQLKKI